MKDNQESCTQRIYGKESTEVADPELLRGDSNRVGDLNIWQKYTQYSTLWIVWKRNIIPKCFLAHLSGGKNDNVFSF